MLSTKICQYLRLFEFTPIAPPIPPVTTTIKSLEEDERSITLPANRDPIIITMIKTINPHTTPRKRPFFLYFFAQIYPPKYAPNASAAMDNTCVIFFGISIFVITNEIIKKINTVIIIAIKALTTTKIGKFTLKYFLLCRKKIPPKEY